MRRPLCLICLLFVLLVMVCMPFFLPYLSQNVLPENQTYADFTGKICEIENPENKAVLYLKNRKQGLSVVCYMSGDISGLKIGNTVRVSGKVRYFESASNDGQFDAKLYYEVLRYDYAMSGCEWVLTDASYQPVLQFLHRIKSEIGKSLDTGLREEDAGILKAMLLGDKKSITSSVKSLYQRNGIAHILAVSGLHITLWGMGFCRLLKKAYIPLPAANLLAFLFVVIYGIMTGSQASAIRSIIMFSLFLLAPVVRRTYDMMTAAALSAAVLLFFNPLYIYHSGFLLSFAAVAGIALLLPCFSKLLSDDSSAHRIITKETSLKNRIKKRIKKLIVSSLTVSLSVTIVSLPIQIYFFYTIPVYSVFLNLIITPLVGVLMVLGMTGSVFGCIFKGIPMVSRGFLYSCHLILAFYEKICTLFDMLPFAHPVIARPAVWRIVLYYVLLIGIMVQASRYKADVDCSDNAHITSGLKIKIGYGVNRRIKNKTESIIRKRILIGLLLMLNIVLVCVRPRFCTRITMLDVGQGDCFVLEEKSGRTIMIDGGSSSVSEVGKYRIIPFLKSHGIKRLDYVFLSHPDADHTNGISEMLKNTEGNGIEISCLVLTDVARGREEYREMLSDCMKSGTKVAYISGGDYLNCGELFFQCLYPKKTYMGDDDFKGDGMSGGDDTNADSMVLLLECGGCKMLFTGDLPGEREADIQLTGRNGEEIGHIDILKVAHHGSKYSSSEELLQRLSPTAALISVGKEQSYGHPHKETLDRLETQGCRIFRTDEDGAVRVKIRNGKFDTFRQISYNVGKSRE